MDSTSLTGGIGRPVHYPCVTSQHPKTGFAGVCWRRRPHWPPEFSLTRFRCVLCQRANNAGNCRLLPPYRHRVPHFSTGPPNRPVAGHGNTAKTTRPRDNGIRNRSSVGARPGAAVQPGNPCKPDTVLGGHNWSTRPRPKGCASTGPVTAALIGVTGLIGVTCLVVADVREILSDRFSGCSLR
jgi:hypothetical protein